MKGNWVNLSIADPLFKKLLENDLPKEENDTGSKLKTLGMKEEP